ncbi:Uncharacterised protein r2_g1415 [Pycnogonum litorale]
MATAAVCGRICGSNYWFRWDLQFNVLIRDEFLRESNPGHLVLTPSVCDAAFGFRAQISLEPGFGELGSHLVHSSRGLAGPRDPAKVCCLNPPIQKCPPNRSQDSQSTRSPNGVTGIEASSALLVVLPKCHLPHHSRCEQIWRLVKRLQSVMDENCRSEVFILYRTFPSK